MDLTARQATEADMERLAEMNRQMCDDERSRNPMSVAALAVRMKSWLSGEWKGVLFERESQIVGYSVFQIGADTYDPAIPEVYVRQFFIVRELRSRGLGRQAFDLLRAEHFPPGAQISLDALASNPRGLRFWESLGFEPYSTALRIWPDK